MILAHPLIAQMQVWAYRRVALSEVEQFRRQHMLPVAAAKIGRLITTFICEMGGDQTVGRTAKLCAVPCRC